MSDQMEAVTDGLDELEKMLSNYSKRIENPVKILEVGAKALAEDVKRLPRPRSSMSGSGYTHLLDTVGYTVKGEEVETGWGKYYGPMVEKGTKKMKGTPHFRTTFDRNKEKYYKLMIDYYSKGV